MSFFQFNHNFYYSQRNQITSKTHLTYRRDISKSIRKLTYIFSWSEKYHVEIEGTNGHSMLQTSDIQLNISLKPETQIEFREKPISDNRNTFQTRHGGTYNMICRVCGTYQSWLIFSNFVVEIVPGKQTLI